MVVKRNFLIAVMFSSLLFICKMTKKISKVLFKHKKEGVGRMFCCVGLQIIYIKTFAFVSHLAVKVVLKIPHSPFSF